MSKKLSRLLLIVVVVLQCGTMLYWASRKAYYFNDEFYTFEYAQNFNNKWDPYEYMPYSSMWQDEKWLSVKDLKTRFTVDEGESVFDRPFRKSFKLFFSRKNYMWILNALETVIGDRVSPTWTSMGLNIFILAMFQFLLFYFLAGLLGLDRRSALLAVAMCGFCPFVLGFAVFCRFYAWTLFLFLIVIVLHRIMWDSDSIVKNIVLEAVSAFLIYVAYRNSELVVFASGCLVLFFTIGLVVRKRYVQSLYYGLPLIGGGIAFLLKQKYFINAVMHPAAFAYDHSRTIKSAYARHTSQMLETSGSEKLNAMWEIVKEYGDSVSGSFYLLAISAVLLVVLFFMARKKLPRRFNGFILILASVAVAFWGFCGVFLFSESRYHSMLFLLAFVTAWWLFDRLIRRIKVRKVFYGIAFGLVAVGAVLPFFRRNVEYVYEDWKPIVESIAEYKDTKNLLVASTRFYVPYASVNLLDESNSIYSIFRKNDLFFDLPELPQSFLLWVDHDDFPRGGISRVFFRGYGIKPLARTAFFDVYVCEKKEDR